MLAVGFMDATQWADVLKFKQEFSEMMAIWGCVTEEGISRHYEVHSPKQAYIFPRS